MVTQTQLRVAEQDGHVMDAEDRLRDAATKAGLVHAYRHVALGLFHVEGGTWPVRVEIRVDAAGRALFKVNRKTDKWRKVGEWRSAVRAVKEAYNAQ